ncbi:hypothetical protein V865_000881 [Kwoniella europaea PYCC6329]|uniref:Amidase domain-containing protein n=1 Tax=Kwoniella europaea PYCC6329 TaxID=1423913 RepID=A0AAX4KA54_9TREE
MSLTETILGTIKPEPELFCHIDGTPYFTPYHHPLHTLPHIPGLKGDKQFQTITVISLPSTPGVPVTREVLEKVIRAYLHEDDVLCPGLMQNIVLRSQNHGTGLVLEESVLEWISQSTQFALVVIDKTINLAQKCSSCSSKIIKLKWPFLEITGSYLYRSENGDSKTGLYPVYRLYPDTSKAFVLGCYPVHDGSGGYSMLNKVDGDGNLMIPVPSRMYSMNRRGSLQGLRLGVKDIFDVEGLPTKAGSRVFAHLNGRFPKQETAPSLIILEEAGAVIVGKVKTSHPFSPRADGCQSCGSSSSGSASAIASYDWLDFSVGSDTDGSIRHPAAIAGIYGVRPTHGLVSTKSVLPALPWVDTVGILARSIDTVKRVMQIWSSEQREKHARLTTLLVPSDDMGNLQQDIKDLFLNFLEDASRAAKINVKKVNISEIVATQVDIIGEDEIPKAIGAWQWKDFGKGIYERYQSRHEGRLPPLGHLVREAFKVAQQEEWDEEKFRRYVELTALEWLPTYREQKLNDISIPLGRHTNPLGPYVPASIGGCPHLVIPIGQVPFHSLLSQRMEMQTICVSLVGPPGTDLSIIGVMLRLKEEEVIKAVQTGGEAFKHQGAALLDENPAT